MKSCWLSVCGAVLAACLSLPVQAATTSFRVVTEDSPPFITDSDGEASGPGKVFVERLMQDAGLGYTHQVYPWARSLALAQRAPNVLIYALARTPDREPQFHWIGELLSMRIHLYAMTGSRVGKVESLEQARQLRIGVVNRDVRLDWLRANGFNDLHPGDASGLDLSENSQVNMLKLRRGLVDVVPVGRSALLGYCRQNHVDCSQFRQVYTLPLTVSLYLAASRATPYEYINTLRYHFRKLVQDGTHDRLFSALE